MEVEKYMLGDEDIEKDETEAYAEVNAIQLALVCQKMFNALRRSVSDMPIPFRKIFKMVYDTIYDKWEDEEVAFRAIGNLFFLRFICSSIVAPHVYGLLEAPANESTQRQLILISKVFQFLASLSIPRGSITALEQMADYMKKNIPHFKKFYRRVIDFDEEEKKESEPLEVPSYVRYNSLGEVYDVLYKNKTHIMKYVEENEEGDIKLCRRIERLVKKYGEPERLYRKKRTGRTRSLLKKIKERK